MSRIPRRRFLITAGAFLSAPLAAQSQSKAWRIGVLSSRPVPTPERPDVVVDAFLKAMRELGYVEGHNLIVERFSAAGDFKLLSERAFDMVREPVDVIVLGSGGTRAAQAVRQATTTIPIVSTAIGDPVLAGLANSLARPGKNVTGITNIAGELELKRFQLLREILPSLDHVAYLMNPDVHGSLVNLGQMQAELKRIGIEVTYLNARSEEEIDHSFAQIRVHRLRGAVFATEATILTLMPKLIALALTHKLPAATGFPEAANAGLLVAYGPHVAERGRQVAAYVDKILKGAKAGDLPMEGPTRFELAINLKTAKALEIAVPQSVIVRADWLIE